MQPRSFFDKHFSYVHAGRNITNTFLTNQMLKIPGFENLFVFIYVNVCHMCAHVSHVCHM